MRPINGVVDVTNYVMMERGQPLHAFDYDRLPKPEITVRRAQDIRVITTLDEQQRQLEQDDLLITSGGEAVAIAGVMGGANSEVDASTKRILLENADHDVFGDGTVVIKTAPGHTPGHQMLFLRLKYFGPLLLEGDLYHLPEERTLDRVPSFDFDGAMTRATRVKTEAFLEETGAQMWIQHDPPTHAKLRKAPAYYD